MYYLIIDLEMTGTESGYHDIIQVGAVLADTNWNKISDFETLVYPNNQDTISKYSEEIHGISLSDLEEAPLPHEMIEDLEDWIRDELNREDNSSLTDVVLCGQSVINDINFLKEEYNRQKYKWPFAYKLIDLLSVSFIFYQLFDNNNVKRPKSYSLKAVSEYFGLEREGESHDALEDAELTYLCFKKYMDLLKKIKI